MKAFTFNDNMSVAFEYREDSILGHDGMYFKGRVANAVIYNGDGGVKGRGRATCVPQDNFSRITGRKLAFKRALENAGLDRGDRTGAWRAFKEHCDVAPRKPERREMKTLYLMIDEYQRVFEIQAAEIERLKGEAT